MRRAATGLLLLMTAVYLISHIWGEDEGSWGYVRAFAEAAMVGGLADWFAVTAIFRRPLGLPIPHTAVIPTNQKRIADSVGHFIADNFLRADLVQARVASKDLSASLGRWLADLPQSRAFATGIVSALPGLLDALDDETVAAFLRRQASDAANGARLAPAFSSVVEALAHQGRHQAILDALLHQGFRLLEDNHQLIREKVRDRTGWMWRMVKVDRQAADSLIVALEDLLREVAMDPSHPVRLRLTETVAKFAADLRDDPVLQHRIESWVREAVSHPTVAQAMEAGWTEFKAALRRDAGSPDSRLRAWLEDALMNVGLGLVRDATVRDALNERIRSLLVQMAERHGKDVSKLVSDTIRAWDANTIVEKLEMNVGRDLQFIRVNGTVIGGLVGLVLHAGAMLLG
ncbi:MAG: DUF445 domain-containing protein [Alphaproteobacteria bacterium]|nr:DUF445 domain-containing protein [Alphaproteobacteria bacterium]